jgi:ribosome-binding factor A
MSGDGRRVQKVEKEVRDIVASYVIRHFAKDLLSVSQVRVAKDLKAATIYISSLKHSPTPDSVLEELQEDAKNIQAEINKKLRMKFCPKLKFVNDAGGDYGEKIDELLSKIRS